MLNHLCWFCFRSSWLPFCKQYSTLTVWHIWIENNIQKTGSVGGSAFRICRPWQGVVLAPSNKKLCERPWLQRHWMPAKLVSLVNNLVQFIMYVTCMRVRIYLHVHFIIYIHIYLFMYVQLLCSASSDVTSELRRHIVEMYASAAVTFLRRALSPLVDG